MSACGRLSFIICVLAGTSALELIPTEWSGDAPLLETRRDVDSYLNNMEQRFRVEMNKEFLKEYTKRSADAGAVQTQIDGVGEPQVLRRADVTATDFFTFERNHYAVISEQTLENTYIAQVSREDNDTLTIRPEGRFSMASFVDSQYSATYQASLRNQVIQLKAHVFADKVFIVTELRDGWTLLFSVSEPRRSWLPKYHDSVLSVDEVASDFVFFEQAGRLFVIVTVSHQRKGGLLIPASVSYIYRLKDGIKWLMTHTVSTPGGATSVTTYTDRRWTYIVIGQNDTQSLVYRLHWDSSDLELFQYLSSSRAVAVQAFTHRTQTYVLLVSRSGAASLFWWTSDQLFVWQSLASGDSDPGAVQFGRVGSFSGGESYIYLVSRNNISFFTTFSSPESHFTLAATHSLPSTTSVRHVQATRVGQNGYYLMISTTDGQGSRDLSVFPLIVQESAEGLSGQRAAVPPPPGSDDLLACLEEVDELLESLDKQLDNLLQLADSVFVQDCDRNVTGEVTVTGTITVTGEADVTELQIVSHQPSGGDTDPVSLDDIIGQITECEASVSVINASLQNALTVSEEQTIAGHYTFTNLDVQGSLFISDASHIETLNDVSYQKLLDSTLTFTGDQTLLYPLSIGSGSVTRLTLVENATLNGIRAADLMYVSGSQTVTGHHQYRQAGVTRNLMLIGPLNDLDLTSMLLRGQTLTVPAASLTQAEVDVLLVKNVNQRDLSEWQRDVLVLDRAQTLPGRMISQTAVFSDLQLTTLNGIHLGTFLRSLWKSPNDRVTGVTTLLGPLSVGDLTAGRVNGVTLTSDLLTTDTDQTVTSYLRLNDLRVTLDLYTDSVNGLDLSTQAVRTTGQPATVSGSVIFAGDLVTGDVTMPDDVTVNGVDISEVSKMTSGGRRTLHFTRGVVLDGDWTVEGSVTVESVNGYTISRLDDVFWSRNTQQDINVPVTISNKLSVKHNLAVGTINGARTDSFIDIQSGGTFRNVVIFLGNVTVHDVTLPEGGTVNGLDLSEFAETVVTRDGDQLIVGLKVFSGTVRTAGLAVLGDLNGLKIPDDVVMVDRDAVQTGSLTFLADLEVVNDVSSSGDVDVLGSVNGFRVKDILANLTNVWVNRTTNHVLVIEGNVHFHDIHVMERMNTGGVLELLESLLHKDHDVTIPGVFTVGGDVQFNSQLTVNTVNGRPWNEYLSSLILSDMGGRVTGMTSVTSSVTVTRPADLRVTSVNGHTLQRLYSRYLTLHTEQLIRHPVTVRGNVSADVLNVKRVNTIPVNQLMFTNRDVHFYQSVDFFSDLVAIELGILSGVIGNCNLTQIWENGLRKSDASQILSSPTTIGSLTVNGDVIVSHGEVTTQLVTLFDRIVTKTGNHSITGEVTFQRPLSVSGAEMFSYGGISLTGLCEDALTTDSSPTVISHPLTLLGPVTFGADVTVTDDVTAGLVNGEEPEQWVSELVLQGDAEVTLRGPLRILQAAVAGHVLATGIINGQPQSAWVERDSDVPVRRLHFDQGLTIIDDLSVAGLVDGVNVTDVLQQSVNLQSNVTIPADIVFTGNVAVWMHLLAPSINGLHLSADLVSTHRLDRMQTVTGAKHFDTLLLDGALCGTLNGVRLSQLCRELLSSSSSAVQVVTQRLAFQHRPANLEEPAVNLADNLTATTALLRKRKEDVTLWTAQLRTDIGRVSSSAATLLQTTDYSVDLAYLLEVQRLPSPEAAAVRSPSRDLRSLDVLLRSEENCSLPDGCLCRATNSLQIDTDGLLRSPGEVLPGQRWTFHVRELQQVLIVTAHTDGYSARCRSPAPARVSVTSRPSGEPSAPPRPLPLTDPLPGHVSDVQIFSVGGSIHMVLTYGFTDDGSGTGTPSHPDTEVLVLDGYRWRTVQRLPAHGATALDLTMVHGVPHLLVVNRHSREPLSLQGEVQLWVWSEDIKQFSELRALYHADIQAVAFLHAHDKMLVVIADLDGLTVLEYSADEHQYSVCQYLAEPGISAVTSFVVGAESYLVVFSTKRNELVVFLVTDQEGLKRHGWYPAAAVRSLAVYSGGQRLMLAAVHRHGLVLYRVVVRGRLSLVTTSAARLPPTRG